MQFELKGQQYRTTNMDVFTQFKVARKLLPVLAGMVSDLNVIKDAAGNQEKVMSAVESVLPKIAGALADMSDDSVDAIIKPCLSVVSRQNGNNWTSLTNSGQLMFDDINLPTMLQIVGKVIGENIGDFLQELPASETQALPAA